MRLKEWAEREGVHHQTAYKWVCEGTMPVPVRRTGKGGRTILVDVPDEAGPVFSLSVGLYARVSSSDQKDDLVRQMDRLKAWALSGGFEVVRVESGVGSGMDGDRDEW
jgi:putative resolvase